MEESRRASVQLVGTADHTGCGIQHSLQFVGRRFRRTRQDNIKSYNYDPSIGAIFNDLERPVIKISRSHQYSTLNMSVTVQDRHIIIYAYNV